MKLTLAGNELELLAERAVWWPAQRTVIVADVHLGKDQVFRRAGIAIPAAVLAEELAALDRLIERCRPDRLLVLGDWVHAAPADGERWPAEIAAWRRHHAELAIDLVLGNHDRRIEPWLPEWGIQARYDSILINQLNMVHEVDSENPEPGLSGHLHPVAWLSAGRERVRLPAFACSREHLILPAFGRFTGGFDGLDRRRWAYFAVAGRRVVAIPNRAGTRRKD
ncbi:MAG: ligase-associated DNA damage response endonuclease PdeM [Wenzhouxiangellaceae bacterium]|nr:ligase-associated DNA damage response endonuclease PdeM [Wenzhouxiangellaceae bacterium]